MNSDDLKLIQVLALRSVEEPTYEDFIVRIQRWYSKTFSTPLADVQNIPDDKLVQVYLEEQYLELYDSEDDKKHQQYQELRAAILDSFEKKDDHAQAEDDDWEAQELARAEKQWEKDLNAIDTTPQPVAKPAVEEPQVPNLTDDSGFVVGEDTIPEE